MMEEQQVINAATILEEHSSERTKCEVYSRIVGYLRPVAQWNLGKKEEFKDRATYDKSREDCIKC
jgi:ribonucleoside-triphosphate reductase